MLHQHQADKDCLLVSNEKHIVYHFYPLMLQPIGPSTFTQFVISLSMEPSSSFIPFDLDFIYEIVPNFGNVNSFMTPQVPSTQPLRTSQ